MSKCPFCSATISPKILIEGGHCPSCDELILGEWNDNDVTEVLDFDDVTEQLEITQPILEIESEQTEDATEDNTDDDSEVAVPQKSTVVNIGVPRHSLGSTKGYILDDEESSDELLDLPTQEASQRFEKYEEKAKTSQKKAQKSKSNGVLVAIFAVIFVGFVAAYSLGLFKKEEIKEEPLKQVNVENLVPDFVEIKEAEEKETKKEVVVTPKKQKKKTKVEEVTRGGITTFKTSGPTLSRPTKSNKKNTSSSEKLKEDVSDLRKALVYCHTRALKKDPTVRGKWEVSFTVQKTGKASKVKISPLRERHSEMESCMKSRVERFSFTKPSSSSYQKFRISFG